MSTRCTIRIATPADAPVIATLLGQLGYPTNAAEAARRLSTLTSTNDRVVVALVDGAVAGVATAQAFRTIHTPGSVVWITSLVVDTAARRHGVGAALVADLESWAREVKAGRIAVTSASHREDAHGFYARLGYERTGLRFAKALA